MSASVFVSDYMGLDRKSFEEAFNSLYASGEFFFFLIDYEQNYFDLVSHSSKCFHGSEFEANDVVFSTPNFSFQQPVPSLPRQIVFEKFPLACSEYAAQFNKVMEAIHIGDTYLLNLTTETPIHTNLTMEQIYKLSQSSYRLNYRNRFLSFSPETFVTMSDGIITAFPMKGTYSSRESAEVASRKMNPKELYEQTTVVDRVRNDLSQICSRVNVEEFLSIQEVITHQSKLYQTVSRVTGELEASFFRDPAGSLLKLLPAASITGAPRDRTVAIIREVESHHRNFYTGVWGVCQQGYLESAVIIRYIEQRDGDLFYKCGGGITVMSDMEAEYQEMIDKIYLPFCYN